MGVAEAADVETNDARLDANVGPHRAALVAMQYQAKRGMRVRG
jgi:hypothetical protein